MAVQRIRGCLLLWSYCLLAICTGASLSASTESNLMTPVTGAPLTTTHVTPKSTTTRASTESSTLPNHTSTAATRGPQNNATSGPTKTSPHVSPGLNETGMPASTVSSPGGTNTTAQTPTSSSAKTAISSATEMRTSLNGTISPQATETTSSQAVPVPKGMAQNPGLVAVLCIFLSVLVIAMVVLIIKFCQRGEPKFQKLDEVPMNGMNEEAPFAHYPPK